MFNKIKNAISYISIITTLTIVLLILVELSCGLFFKFLPILSGIYTHGYYPKYVDYRVESPAYTDKTHANEIYKEFFLVQEQYVPYTIWRYKELHGKHININEDGIRATIPNSNDKSDKKLFFFGGSTIWGTGVDDNNTIPSFVSRYLKENNLTFDIVNYGQSGYQSTQELIQLISELQKGKRPAVVIFYDGINDIYASAFSPGIPSYHQNFEQIKNKIEGNGIKMIYFNSNLFKMVIYIKNRFKRTTLKQEDTEEDEKIEGAIDNYITNLQMVQKLSKEYGFKFFAFWQPVLLADKKKLTEYEKIEKSKMGKKLMRIYTKAYEGINKKHLNKIKLFNLSEIFENEKDDIYTDFAHLAEKGNSIVARKIFEDIREEIFTKK